MDEGVAERQAIKKPQLRLLWVPAVVVIVAGNTAQSVDRGSEWAFRCLIFYFCFQRTDCAFRTFVSAGLCYCYEWLCGLTGTLLLLLVCRLS